MPTVWSTFCVPLRTCSFSLSIAAPRCALDFLVSSLLVPSLSSQKKPFCFFVLHTAVQILSHPLPHNTFHTPPYPTTPSSSSTTTRPKKKIMLLYFTLFSFAKHRKVPQQHQTNKLIGQLCLADAHLASTAQHRTRTRNPNCVVSQLRKEAFKESKGHTIAIA